MDCREGVLMVTETHEKRDQLVADGYTVIPGVFGEALLQEFRDWSEEYFGQHEVEHRYRYQGSDVSVISPARWARGDIPAPRAGDKSERILSDPIVDQFLDDPGLQMACKSLQLEGLKSSENLLILAKPAHGPPLYWHQDFMNWNSPIAATPWPTKVFLSTYLTDTSVENGCLRVIPGTHLRRIDLHDMIPDAHGEDAQALESLDVPAIMEHPDAVDLPMRAGDMVGADARLLHAAHPNTTDARRTLMLAWHDVFPFPEPPSWWTDPIPTVVREADPTVEYEPRRSPSKYLR